MTKMPTFHLTQWPHVKVAFLLVIMRDSCTLVMKKEMMCSAHKTPNTWLDPVARKTEWHKGHFCHWQTAGFLGQKNYMWAIPVAPALPSWNSKCLGKGAYQALHCYFKCVLCKSDLSYAPAVREGMSPYMDVPQYVHGVSLISGGLILQREMH